MPTAPDVTDHPQPSRYELWLGTTQAGFIRDRAEPGTVLVVLHAMQFRPPPTPGQGASGQPNGRLRVTVAVR